MDLITVILLVLLIVLSFLAMQYDPEQSRIKKLLNKIPGPPTVPIFGNAWDLFRRPLHSKYFFVIHI
ncbi:hypothetical protein C0J52_09957 [Blattella germanica]|nr:hypothetical protein C0J52_09957 [Blattella germanica]